MTVEIGVRGLLDVTSFTVMTQVLADTIGWLQDAGAVGFEAFVVWTGRLLDVSTFEFTTAVRPGQVPVVTTGGVGVHVPGDSLHDLNRSCFERGEILAGQVHTHPAGAYHSELDDQFPLVTLLGGLSVVVPDFADRGLSAFDHWEWYRLVGPSNWQPVAMGDVVEVV